jgi:hypothetical protein
MMVGFGVGYYLGAKAGRERYQQLNATLQKAKRSEVYEEATDKAKAVIDLTVERAKGFVEEHTPLGGHGAAPVDSEVIAVPSPT